MLQHHRGPAPGAAFGDVFHDGVGVGGLPGISRGHVPVKILVAHIRKGGGQAGHYARIETAHGIGAAPGEAAQLGVAAGLVVYQLLHGVEVLEEGLLAGVYALIVVGIGVYAYGVPLPVGPAYLVEVFGVCPGDKEGGLHIVLGQNVQELPGIGAGAVVKGQVYGIHVGRDYIRVVHRQHRHGALGADHIPGLALDGISQFVAARLVGADLPRHLHQLRHVVAHAVFCAVARVVEAQAGVEAYLAAPLQENLRLALGIQGLSHHGGGVARGVGDGVDHTVVLQTAFHLLRQVPVIVVGGGIALLLIAAHPGGLITRQIFQLQHWRNPVHHLHLSLGAVLLKQVADSVLYRILPQFGVVQLAGSLHMEMLLPLAEYGARAHRIDSRLLVGLKALQLQLLGPGEVEAHMAPVHYHRRRGDAYGIYQQYGQHHQAGFSRHQLFQFFKKMLHIFLCSFLLHYVSLLIIHLSCGNGINI